MNEDPTELPGTDSLAETRLESGSSAKGSGTSGSDHPRFIPGTLVAGRYRVVSLLGRGGMGEVYRADDLELGETVALKFLPEHLARDPALLRRMRDEVRLARRVASPHVCRVFDLTENDGQPFLSMEWVDGEDLSTLLRRIGRLPGDKALEVARQLCVGLAAAHAEGILHRDLKPANVMIDGRGRAKIMDFGLAVHESPDDPGQVREGTPAYMAPEQLRGEAVTERSDLFSLGLILHELTTGRPAFEPRSLDALKELHSSGWQLDRTSQSGDLDPVLSQLIDRCLMPDPEARPPSAVALLGALPGQDPLAAALAAGETPSPELVAAAEASRPLSTRWAQALLAAFAVTLVANAWFYPRLHPIGRSALPKAPLVLEEKALEIRRSFGYEPLPHDASGLDVDLDYFAHLRESDDAGRWQHLETEDAPAITFWSRDSERVLNPGYPVWRTTPTSPPLGPGMTRITLTQEGRLISFEATPRSQPAHANAVSPAPNDWLPRALEAAGIEPTSLREAPPTPYPSSFAERRRRLTGPDPAVPGRDLEIHTATHAARPVLFKVRRAWQPEEATAGARGTWGVLQPIIAGITVLVFALGLFLVRRNWRSGRGDREGARRLGLAAGLTHAVLWLLAHPHDGSLLEQLTDVSRIGAHSLWLGAVFWFCYLAIEPSLRRRHPQMLVSWTRLLQGRWNDPLVGRDVLLGATALLSLKTLSLALQEISVRTGMKIPINDDLWISSIAGMRATVDTIDSVIFVALSNAFGIAFLYLALLLLLRKPRPAAIAHATLSVVVVTAIGGDWTNPWILVPTILTSLAITWLLVRIGFLCSLAFWFMLFLVEKLPLSTDFSTWFTPSTMLTWLIALALGAWCWRALAGGRLHSTPGIR